MNAIVEQALVLWGLEGAEYILVATRENAVYKITTEHHMFALRLHRQGYRTDIELQSELQWMEAAASGGIRVPAPLPSLSGDMLHVLDDVQVDVLTWLSGVTLDAALEGLLPTARAVLFYRVGQEMACLHDVSDAWEQPARFARCAWDRDGLLGEAPLWGRFWDNPALTSHDRDLFLAMRDKAYAELAKLEAKLDYGLIHADLVSANVMVDGDQIQLIDFDDGGFGFRLFDIATALLKHLDAPDFSTLRTGLIEGYTSVRPIDLAVLDLFILLRSATYVGWNITRMTEDGTSGRNARFISTTKQLATAYMEPDGI
ncbi:homoserine kinase [Sulfitobacter sp. SK012]|uniref:phosphotransferase enzyme family protein n=1 Tax=Sulfitobacter sp. SK012 TaxID=1389005 RepID=UPI000E0B4ED8|nr:phosphotransferase [Sulfitobacter sp. SK012]AXI46593.1 homoserine kinase [Sulfitobacter sp. SK012]